MALEAASAPRRRLLRPRRPAGGAARARRRPPPALSRQRDRHRRLGAPAQRLRRHRTGPARGSADPRRSSPRPVARLLLALLLAAAIAPGCSCRRARSPRGAFALGLLLAVYALPPLRLKERGAAGLVVDALYGHALPMAIVVGLFAPAPDPPPSRPGAGRATGRPPSPSRSSSGSSRRVSVAPSPARSPTAGTTAAPAPPPGSRRRGVPALSPRGGSSCASSLRSSRSSSPRWPHWRRAGRSCRRLPPLPRRPAGPDPRQLEADHRLLSPRLPGLRAPQRLPRALAAALRSRRTDHERSLLAAPRRGPPPALRSGIGDLLRALFPRAAR
ncbi:MAG: hypothetical protein R2862_00530 [Thermoanaerobaculia bacterium]